jgi:hypothetical protein
MADADIYMASRADNALIHFISLPPDNGIVARERLNHLNYPIQTHSGPQQSRLRSQSRANKGSRKTAKDSDKGTHCHARHLKSASRFSSSPDSGESEREWCDSFMELRP